MEQGTPVCLFWPQVLRFWIYKEEEMRMKRNLLISLIAAAGISMFATSIMAQDGAGSTGGYGVQQGGSAVWKNSTGLCWRSGSWTPAAATEECDADLVKKEPKPEPVAEKAPEAAPAAPVAPAAPEVVKITLSTTALFDFNKSALKSGGKKALDREVLAKLKSLKSFEIVVVNGYTDSIGSEKYNQKLSEHRAQAVRQYLVSQGIKGEQVEAKGLGESNPVVKCGKQKSRKKQITCEAPNRRVEVEVHGQSVKEAN
jgi:OmpA-OmpF porin, OOP family